MMSKPFKKALKKVLATYQNYLPTKLNHYGISIKLGWGCRQLLHFFLYQYDPVELYTVQSSKSFWR